MTSEGRIVFAAARGAVSSQVLGDNDGLVVETVASAAELRALLADRYDVVLGVVELALADAALREQLQRPGAPRTIFLLDDEFDAPFARHARSHKAKFLRWLWTA